MLGVQRLASVEPVNERLEPVLIHSEIELHHVMHHWFRLVSTLRESGLWMETDLGEDESGASLGNVDED